MAMAAGKAGLDLCPHVSEAAKETLGSASAPPIKLVKVGVGDRAVELGDETVIFRHDKTFYHPTTIAVEVLDTLSDAELDAKIAKINGLVMERVGQEISVNMIAITNASGNVATFKAVVEKVAAKTEFALLLVSDDVAAFEAVVPGVAAKKPLLSAATAANWEKMVAIAKANNVPLVVKGDGLDATAELVTKVAAQYKELVIDTGSRQTAKVLAELTNIRRLATKKKFRPFGYPVLTFTTSADAKEEILQAGVYVAKFASIIVLKADEKALILPLLTLRQNIYTDPQKPIAVEAKIYEIGAVTPDSPMYVCTNFALTYFAVEGEVIASKLPAYIVAVDTDGTSVLTSWASGKFVPETITEFIEKVDAISKVNHKTMVIPGYVAIISGKLAEKSGWTVVVGPQEAAGIPAFAKAKYANLYK